MDLENSLEKYAELIVHTGLNLQAGEKPMIRANAEGLELVRKVAKAAYQAGVVDVKLLFQDDQLSLTRYLHAPDSAFETYPEYEVEYTEALYKDGYQILVLSGVDPNPQNSRSQTYQHLPETAGIATKRIQHYTMENKTSGVLLVRLRTGGPKVPSRPSGGGQGQALQNIFAATRVDQEDPVAAWQAHDEEFKRHMDFLNEAKFEKIVFEGPGTDLVVSLAEGNRWDGGSGRARLASRFPEYANRRDFSMPHADKVNGKITATSSLSLRGQLVDKFWFKFEDGKVTDFDAAQGKEILQGLLDTDEGARRLVIALVAHHSPISQTGVLFKNTLFDENAPPSGLGQPTAIRCKAPPAALRRKTGNWA